MNDGPRDQKSDGYDTADEPTTGPPAGAVSASALDAGSHPGSATAPSDAESRDAQGITPDSGSTGLFRSRRSADPDSASGTRSAVAGSATRSAGADPGTRSAGADPSTRPAGATTGSRSAKTGSRPAGSPAGAARSPEAEAETRKRRKRRLLVAGISVGAALVVIAICAGGLTVLRAFSGFRTNAADAREDRRLRDAACLELEDRLNRLVPPGATATPQARAVTIRNENGATRIYVGRLDNQRVSDGWRELLDARTSYAEDLDAQVKSRTPAFYVAPAPRDGISLAEQLTRWSPPACAGPIRRLAVPDL
jgi:hypothetical protein